MAGVIVVDRLYCLIMFDPFANKQSFQSCSRAGRQCLRGVWLFAWHTVFKIYTLSIFTMSIL